MNNSVMTESGIISRPEELDSNAFISGMKGSEFIMIHDFLASKTAIASSDKKSLEGLEELLPGIKFAKKNETRIESAKGLVVFFQGGYDDLLEDAYKILCGIDGRLFVCFTRPDQNKIRTFKGRVEELLSKKELRMTKTSGAKVAGTSSTQSELYYESDEKTILLGMLGELNQISALNGNGYELLFVIDEKGEEIENYVKSKGLLLESFRLKCNDMGSLFSCAKKSGGMPISYVSASRCISISGTIESKEAIKSEHFSSGEGEIEIGKLLKDSIAATQIPIAIQKSSLNLGTIITGLPGVGKSLAAMSLFSKIKGSAGKKTSVVVISPTKEWSEFASDHNLTCIRIYDSQIPINFFSCNNESFKEKFYENLAMLLAHASNAGPYQNSLEKCLLAAFRKIYAQNLCPDPTEVYEEIEEAIIERHAKRSNVGIKYTKHGENIRAALENLRQLLFKPEFAAVEGIDIDRLLENGVVFDLSSVGNSMKQFFYALLLNRIYFYSDLFDEQGNDELRLEIVLEEAQLALSQNELSAINIDLKQRIQDFRKKGIGICLITHSATDIPVSIRRLCQTKLYFRQSFDIAKYAALDLALEESATARLRSLEQGAFAANYIQIKENQRVPRGPVFGATEHVEREENFAKVEFERLENPMICNCKVKITNGNAPSPNLKLELSYIGTIVARSQTNQEGEVVFANLIKGKKYLLAILGEKKKETKLKQIFASDEVEINLALLTTSS